MILCTIIALCDILGNTEGNMKFPIKIFVSVSEHLTEK